MLLLGQIAPKQLRSIIATAQTSLMTRRKLHALIAFPRLFTKIRQLYKTELISSTFRRCKYMFLIAGYGKIHVYSELLLTKTEKTIEFVCSNDILPHLPKYPRFVYQSLDITNGHSELDDPKTFSNGGRFSDVVLCCHNNRRQDTYTPC